MVEPFQLDFLFPLRLAQRDSRRSLFQRIFVSRTCGPSSHHLIHSESSKRKRLYGMKKLQTNIILALLLTKQSKLLLGVAVSRLTCNTVMHLLPKKFPRSLLQASAAVILVPWLVCKWSFLLEKCSCGRVSVSLSNPAMRRNSGHCNDGNDIFHKLWMNEWIKRINSGMNSDECTERSCIWYLWVNWDTTHVRSTLLNNAKQAVKSFLA